MLKIVIPGTDGWDEVNERFVKAQPAQTLSLEHSLVSLAKWESKWNVPFLEKKPPKTYEQTIDYIRCMTLTQNVDPSVYDRLSDENISEIQAYIEAPMTAAWFSDDGTPNKPSREKTTADLIYYWMIALNIPFECQKWHLNRLLTLIRICGIKNQPPKKLKGRSLMNQNRALNAARRKQHNTKG